jgi:hypothetical protein
MLSSNLSLGVLLELDIFDPCKLYFTAPTCAGFSNVLEARLTCRNETEIELKQNILSQTSTHVEKNSCNKHETTLKRHVIFIALVSANQRAATTATYAYRASVNSYFRSYLLII